MKRTNSVNKGFTLVELLVVITIIGMLMALLLPAVNNAVEAARATQCRTNTRNLALACINFEFRFGRYPGYNETHSDVGGPISWITAVLPQLERDDIYKKYNQLLTSTSSTGSTPPYMEVLVCPSDPPTETSGPCNNYVINVGNMATGTSSNPDNPSAGISHNFQGSGAGSGLYTTADNVVSGDGASTTVLISENVQAGTNGTAKPESWSKGLNGNWAATGKSANGFGYYHAMSNGKRINADINATVAGADAKYARPSSYHTGVVHVAFCDGHAITLRQDIGYTVYQQLCTPFNEEAGFANGHATLSYLLDEGDFR